MTKPNQTTAKSPQTESSTIVTPTQTVDSATQPAQGESSTIPETGDPETEDQDNK